MVGKGRKSGVYVIPCPECGTTNQIDVPDFKACKKCGRVFGQPDIDSALIDRAKRMRDIKAGVSKRKGN